jgi:hypothetical protein
MVSSQQNNQQTTIVHVVYVDVKFCPSPVKERKPEFVSDWISLSSYAYFSFLYGRSGVQNADGKTFTPAEIFYNFLSLSGGSRDSSVGTTAGYELDDRSVGVRVALGSRFLSSPQRQDRLWGPPSFLANGYRQFIPNLKDAETRNWPLTSN